MKKKQTKHKIPTNKILKRISWILVLILALLGFVGVGYYVGYIDGSQYPPTPTTKPANEKMKVGEKKEHRPISAEKNETLTPEKNESKHKPEHLNVPAVQNSSKQEDELKTHLQSVLDEAQNRYAQKGASHEYEGNPELLNKPVKANVEAPQKKNKAVEPEPKKQDKSSKNETQVKKTQQAQKEERQEPKNTGLRPKLAIIIDDVSFEKEVKALKGLHIPLTMSFLPPTSVHPDSAKLAANEPFYMVHLPMSAVSFNGAEPLTLNVDDSQQTISSRVEEVMKLFPKVHYINNHTGSKFTADESSVRKLIVAFKKYDIHFIDSRTTPETKVAKVMQEQGERYIGRDVFLDHTMDVASVKKQIAEAIRVAKTRGYAIAIGHPHPNTIQALKESKTLLLDVDLVLINKI
jgi:hypothetical protein